MPNWPTSPRNFSATARIKNSRLVPKLVLIHVLLGNIHLGGIGNGRENFVSIIFILSRLWVHIVQQTMNWGFQLLVPLTTWNLVIVLKSSWFDILTFLVPKLLSRFGVKLFNVNTWLPTKISIYLSEWILKLQVSAHFTANLQNPTNQNSWWKPHKTKGNHWASLNYNQHKPLFYQNRTSKNTNSRFFCPTRLRSQ